MQADFPDESKKEKDQLSHHNGQLQQMIKKLAHENETLRKGLGKIEKEVKPRRSLERYAE